MQLNLHVPKDRERLVGRLDAAARRLGRPKSQIVLDALERYLDADEGGPAWQIGQSVVPVFHLGEMPPFRRADLYDDGTEDA
jgi:hypothetical protein